MFTKLQAKTESMGLFMRAYFAEAIPGASITH